MITALEYRGHQATYNAVLGEPVVMHMTETGAAIVPLGETVTVCAWHSGAKQLTEHLTKIGYQVSHGICSECKTKWKQDIMRSQLK